MGCGRHSESPNLTEKLPQLKTSTPHGLGVTAGVSNRVFIETAPAGPNGGSAGPLKCFGSYEPTNHM